MNLTALVCPNCRSVYAPLPDSVASDPYQCPVCRKTVKGEKHEIAEIVQS